MIVSTRVEHVYRTRFFENSRSYFAASAKTFYRENRSSGDRGSRQTYNDYSRRGGREVHSVIYPHEMAENVRKLFTVIRLHFVSGTSGRDHTDARHDWIRNCKNRALFIYITRI